MSDVFLHTAQCNHIVFYKLALHTKQSCNFKSVMLYLSVKSIEELKLSFERNTFVKHSKYLATSL